MTDELDDELQNGLDGAEFAMFWTCVTICTVALAALVVWAVR